MIARPPPPSEANAFRADHARLLRSSLRRLAGQELCSASMDDTEAARAIWQAPFAVVSHDTAPDPIFNYANRTALEWFEMTWEEFTALPSRESAEAPERVERERLLAEVTARGFIKDYSGIRTSRSGRRFRIDDAVVWNVTDESGAPRGQAAMFRSCRYL